MKKTFIVFGAGRMGSVAAMRLLLDGDVNVKVVDYDDHAFEKFNLDVCDNIELIKTDGSDDSLNQIFSGANVCIATSGYQSYKKITEACIAYKVHMVDLGGNTETVKEQYALNDKAIEAGVTIVPDCGLAPGMIGILGMNAFNELIKLSAKIAVDVHMKVGGLPRDPGPIETNPLRYALTWSADGLINEYEIPSVEINDGKLVTVPALSNLELMSIKTSLNDIIDYEAFVTGGGSSNLPLLLKGKARNVSYKTIRYEGHMAAMMGFKQLGFFEQGSQLRAALRNELEKQLILKDNDDIVIAKVHASGRYCDSMRVASIEYDVFCGKNNGLSAMAQTTAYSAVTVARMIAETPNMPRGVQSGELIIDGNNFIKRMANVGIVVNEKRYI